MFWTRKTTAVLVFDLSALAEVHVQAIYLLTLWNLIMKEVRVFFMEMIAANKKN